jgi:hypothetical protein
MKITTPILVRETVYPSPSVNSLSVEVDFERWLSREWHLVHRRAGMVVHAVGTGIYLIPGQCIPSSIQRRWWTRLSMMKEASE